jgi:hypothetical protein
VFVVCGAGFTPNKVLGIRHIHSSTGAVLSTATDQSFHPEPSTAIFPVTLAVSIPSLDSLLDVQGRSNF